VRDATNDRPKLGRPLKLQPARKAGLLQAVLAGPIATRVSGRKLTSAAAPQSVIA
jgi:hypothetical protein